MFFIHALHREMQIFKDSASIDWNSFHPANLLHKPIQEFLILNILFFFSLPALNLSIPFTGDSSRNPNPFFLEYPLTVPRAYVEINCSPPFIVIFLGCPPRNLRRGQRRRSRRIPSLAHTDLHHDFSTDEKGREEEEEIRAHASTRGARDCRGPGEAGARASSSSPSSWSRANGIARVRFCTLQNNLQGWGQRHLCG